MGAHDHAPLGDPSCFSPSMVPALPHSTHFRENLARATQVFRVAGADHWQSDDSLGNAATFHDAHV